jgi:hypothetical protein
LNHPSLRQLKQRIGLRCSLAPLTLAETIAYIAARVRVAGGEASTLFSPEAVQLVHERSGGIPRTISVICDNALVSGYALDRRPIDRSIVLEVCTDFDFTEPGPEESTEPPAYEPETAPNPAAAAASGLLRHLEKFRLPSRG